MNLADALFTALVITLLAAVVWYCVLPRPLRPGEPDDYNGHD